MSNTIIENNFYVYYRRWIAVLNVGVLNGFFSGSINFGKVSLGEYSSILDVQGKNSCIHS